MQLIDARKLRATLLVALVGLVSACGLVYGQGTNGSLTGQVTDSTGAAIVGAKVTTNMRTNFSFLRHGPSDLTTLYELQTGAARQLFAQSSAPGVCRIYPDRHCDECQPLCHAKRAPEEWPARRRSRECDGRCELINTTSAELGMTVNEQSVSRLPLNGRDPSTSLCWRRAWWMLEKPALLGAVGLPFPGESRLQPTAAASAAPTT